MANRFGQRLIASVLGVAITSLNFGSSLPVTKRGVQCPTAAIQTVVEVEHEKNCCGELVAKTIVREPREGEVGFKQCCCAEKKAADHKVEKQTTSVSKPTLVCALGDKFPNQSYEPIISSPKISSLAGSSCIGPVFEPPTPPSQSIELSHSLLVCMTHHAD